MFLLLWIRIGKLYSTKNSSIVCVTDLTPAELCLGYTLNREGGEVAVQSRRIGFLLHCLVSVLYYLYLLLFTCFVLSFTLLCLLSCLFSVVYLYLFPGLFHPFFYYFLYIPWPHPPVNCVRAWQFLLHLRLPIFVCLSFFSALSSHLTLSFI
jgi:hypothetical protein